MHNLDFITGHSSLITAQMGSVTPLSLALAWRYTSFILLGCHTHTRYDHAMHDKAIGLRSQPFQTVITSPRLNCHLLESDLNVMAVRLDIAGTHYTTAMITTEELSKAWH